MEQESVISHFFSTKKNFGILFIAILAISIPLTIGLVQRQQDVRQRAAENILTAGPKNPNGFSQDQSVGNTPWTSTGVEPLGFIASLDGNVIQSSPSAGSSTFYVKATDFGFTIPSGSLINGIRVEIASTGNGGTDSHIKLIKDGAIVGEDRARGVPWGNSSYVSYGGDADLWGATFSPSQVNSDDFGVAISAKATDLGSPNIDNVRMTVYYSPSLTQGPSPTATPSARLNPKYDFNDDGVVDGADLNILYTSFSGRHGD